MTKVKIIKAIEQAGILLVYPIQNQKEPPSIWHALYPKSRMSWDWAETADDRVVDLWHQRTLLSESRRVVYAKWFQGRATFFSRPVFAAMLRVLDSHDRQRTLPEEAAAVYRLLLDDSPQTPKMLREALGLEGRSNEARFSRGLAELWRRLVVVGFGELDEGSYPSLQIGATKHLFEDLWDEAAELSLEEAEARLERVLPPDSAFARQLKRLRNKARRETPAPDRALRRPRKASNELI